MFHQASKPTSLLVLFLYIILYPHSALICHWLLFGGLNILLGALSWSPHNTKELLTMCFKQILAGGSILGFFFFNLVETGCLHFSPRTSASALAISPTGGW